VDRFYIEQTFKNKVTGEVERKLLGKNSYLMRKELMQENGSFKTYLDRTKTSFYVSKYAYKSTGYAQRVINILKENFPHGSVYEIEYKIVCLEGEE